ncbi:MAG TPA: flavodoxin, partial [Kosmotogaceae bacterium]|nr:flavodoxin [Kosmotogaceae bacterium]
MKTLIIYSSKTGTTEKAAKKLAGLLEHETSIVRVKDFDTEGFSRYDSIIIGSAVRVGTALKESRNFVSRNLIQLLEKKLAVFLCMADEEGRLGDYLSRSYPREFLDACLVKSSFGGEINFEKMGFFLRGFMKKMMKDKEAPA